MHYNSRCNDTLAKLAAEKFKVVLLGIRLPGMSGTEVLTKIRSNHSNAATVMITAVNDVDRAVEPMKFGALDYVVKPFNLDRVNTSIRTVLEAKKRLPERRDCEIPHCVGGEDEEKQATEKCFSELNTVARGVEAKQDLLTGHSKIVTRATIDIVWRLGTPEKEIWRWLGVRTTLDSERRRVIESSLAKPE